MFGTKGTVFGRGTLLGRKGIVWSYIYDHISHMTTVSISELKARLSAFLDIVRNGEDVMVTDRGRLIARLTPVLADDLEESRRELLLRSGQLRAPSAKLSADFLRRHRPHDTTGASLAALLDEREDGR